VLPLSGAKGREGRKEREDALQQTFLSKNTVPFIGDSKRLINFNNVDFYEPLD
jgi:hypothetical protein